MVWKKSYEFCLLVYGITAYFPKEELQGSGAELETQILIARDLGYIKEKEYTELNLLLNSVMKMLTVFIQKLSTSNQ